MKLPNYLKIYVGIVVLNYIAQIPYTIHQYGLNFGFEGALLLSATLLLFLIPLWALVKKKSWGYWLMLFYISLQVLFYFNNTFLSLLHGGGILYHLQVHDPVLMVIFLIGDLNGFVADYYLFYFLKNKKKILKT